MSIPNSIFHIRIIFRCQYGYDSPFIEDAWPCEYLYNGQGIEYQILAGPVFVVVGTVSALVFGALSDKFHRSDSIMQVGEAPRNESCVFCRPLLLGIATSVASICGILMATAQEYWHLVILRMITSSGYVTPVMRVHATTNSSRNRWLPSGERLTEGAPRTHL